MDASEKRRLILKGCEKWKGHWLRVYLMNGSDFRVKAEELKEMVEKNQLNLNLVKNVEVDDEYRKFKPMPKRELRIPKKHLPISGSGGNSGSGGDDEDKRWGVLLGILTVLVVVGLLLRR
ncbi:hypothetical protein [Thermococcus aciditolerans]|uniref:Uncharacterized protein n=1 Tax=Thermococcus aciditolerans TaxID=2598455 RepID=A0A5C0SK81_9EURY|nr:hypothetical protein [Thermococcus aciditolerans]QEK14731.1 hypothetical protein FPV09_06080 [Thermococcus aciditolerans]